MFDNLFDNLLFQSNRNAHHILELFTILFMMLSLSYYSK